MALAILAASMAVLSQLVTIGLRAARNARDLTHAQLLCESVVSEIAAGALPAEPVMNRPLELGWVYSVLMQQSQAEGMILLTAIVRRDTTSRRATQFSMSQWIRNPQLEFPTEEEDATGAAGDSTSSGGAG